MEYNSWDDWLRFARLKKMAWYDQIISWFCIGRETPRNTLDQEFSIAMTFIGIMLIAGVFGIAKLLIGIPFLTVIGLGFCLGAVITFPMINYVNNYLQGIVSLVIGVIGYFTNFMTLKIFSFDTFPYLMLIMAAMGALTIIRRLWNGLNWKLSDYLHVKYNVEGINEELLNETYERKQYENN